jgi:hypothetical protein
MNRPEQQVSIRLAPLAQGLCCGLGRPQNASTSTPLPAVVVLRDWGGGGLIPPFPKTWERMGHPPAIRGGPFHRPFDSAQGRL